MTIFNYTISINVELASQLLLGDPLPNLEALLMESIDFDTIEAAIHSLNANMTAMCAKLDTSGKHKIYSVVNEGKDLAWVEPWESDEVCRMYITDESVEVKTAIGDPIVEASVFKMES